MNVATTPAQQASDVAASLEGMGIARDTTKTGSQLSWFCGSDLRSAKYLVRRYRKVFGVEPAGFNVSGGIIGLTH
jgi:hypothetical protein